MRGLKDLKLKYQIALLIGISIFLVITFQLITYFRVSFLIQNRARVYSLTSINQVEENLQSCINNVEEVGYKIAYNKFLQDYLTTDLFLLKKDLQVHIDDFIDYVIETNDDINGIGFVEEDGNWINFYGSFNYLFFQDIKNKYDFVNEEFNKIRFITIFRDDKTYYATLIPIFSIKQSSKINRRIGTAIILSKIDNIEHIFDKLTATTDSSFFIKYKNEIVVASGKIPTERRILNKEIEDIKEGNDYIVQEKVLEELEWKIYGLISSKNVTSDLRFFQIYIYITEIIMIILMLVTGIILNNNISRPIMKISESMQQIGEKHIKQRVDLSIKGDLGIIVKHINKMLDKLEKMAQIDIQTHKQLYEVEMSKKQAELSALQSQINPHFLYNTLECMRSIGMVYDSNEIVDISTAMADIFRYSIKEDNFVKVKMELKIINEYLKIMQHRFKDRFICEIDIDERMLEQKIIKMSLQPIIENAIYHGLENKTGKGYLSIRGILEDKFMIFKIEDNGQGIEEKELKLLQEKLRSAAEEKIFSDKRKHIGLININKRIKLYIGEEYGLSILSKKENGTLVWIKLPMDSAIL